MFTFPVLDLCLKVFCKKLTWHFDVTSLISQEFTRRDLNQVSFLIMKLQV